VECRRQCQAGCHTEEQLSDGSSRHLTAGPLDGATYQGSPCVDSGQRGLPLRAICDRDQNFARVFRVGLACVVARAKKASLEKSPGTKTPRTGNLWRDIRNANAHETLSYGSWAVSRTERGGFEPPVGFDPHAALAKRCYRPLSHLSGPFGRITFIAGTTTKASQISGARSNGCGSKRGIWFCRSHLYGWISRFRSRP
jgi:hypothetical protein